MGFPYINTLIQQGFTNPSIYVLYIYTYVYYMSTHTSIQLPKKKGIWYYPSIKKKICLSVYVPVCLSLQLIDIYIYTYINVCIYKYVSICIYMYYVHMILVLYYNICFGIIMYRYKIGFYPSNNFSICPGVCLSICLSTYIKNYIYIYTNI